MKSKDVILAPDNVVVFDEMISIIERAREKAFRAVNRELITMYWEIGRLISEKVSAKHWGKSVVQEFSKHVQFQFLGIKGFSPQNIWRMRQFYEIYRENEKLSTLSREISWSNSVSQRDVSTERRIPTGCVNGGVRRFLPRDSSLRDGATPRHPVGMCLSVENGIFHIYASCRDASFGKFIPAGYYSRDAHIP